MCVCVCVYKYSIFTSVSASLAGGGAVFSWCHHWLCSWTPGTRAGWCTAREERRYDGVLGPCSTYGCGSFYFWGNLMLKSEKAVAPHSSTLAWKIPWMEEPGRLQPMGSLGVGHDWATSLSRVGEGNGNPLQCSCLENPRDGGAWWAAVSGVAQSRTRLKRFSSSSSNVKIMYLEFLYVADQPLNDLVSVHFHI